MRYVITYPTVLCIEIDESIITALVVYSRKSCRTDEIIPRMTSGLICNYYIQLFEQRCMYEVDAESISYYTRIIIYNILI